jgi:hypothetical protein
LNFLDLIQNKQHRPAGAVGLKLNPTPLGLDPFHPRRKRIVCGGVNGWKRQFAHHLVGDGRLADLARTGEYLKDRLRRLDLFKQDRDQGSFKLHHEKSNSLI